MFVRKSAKGTVLAESVVQKHRDAVVGKGVDDIGMGGQALVDESDGLAKIHGRDRRAAGEFAFSHQITLGHVLEPFDIVKLSEVVDVYRCQH